MSRPHKASRSCPRAVASMALITAPVSILALSVESVPVRAWPRGQALTPARRAVRQADHSVVLTWITSGLGEGPAIGDRIADRRPTLAIPSDGVAVCVPGVTDCRPVTQAMPSM